MSKPQHRGSRSAFMWGRTVFTRYGGGCLRNILISSRIPKVGDIDPIHSTRGLLYEDTYAARLDAAGTPYERELAIFDERERGIFTGHIDFEIDGKLIVELKSSQSKSRLRDIKKGEYVEDNLAQAVSYMIARESADGKLIYSYWEPQADGTLKLELEYEHKILIDSFGRICLNDVATKWTVHDVLSHQHHVFKVQSENTVWERPHNYGLLWGSPCTYCPFKKACDAYDTGEVVGLDGLLDNAKRDTVSLATINSNEEVPNE